MADHHHSHAGSGGRIGLTFILNLVFTLIEFIGGFLTNSTAIMADAVHDLGDTLAIGLGWILNRLSQQHANSIYTYGYYRLSLLGALINGTILVVGSLWILSEAIPRLTDPEIPHAFGMTALAVLGVAVNGFAAYKLSKGKTLNEQILNWHLLEDVLGWLAVLIVSIVLLFTDWAILDPLLSIAFTLFILINVARNLGTTVRLFMQGAPDKQLSKDVEDLLLAIDHIADIHHLHIWSLDGEHHVMTVHLVLDKPISNEVQDEIKRAVKAALADYGFAHTTIELEQHLEECRDAAEKTGN